MTKDERRRAVHLLAVAVGGGDGHLGRERLAGELGRTTRSLRRWVTDGDQTPNPNERQAAMRDRYGAPISWEDIKDAAERLGAVDAVWVATT